VGVSLLAVVSTLYVYDEVLYKHNNGLMISRLLGRNRRKRYKKWLQQPRKNLVWLMSYPSGGADDIITIVERATFKSMATNYGNVVQGRDMERYTNQDKSELLQRRWYGSGPFKNNKDFPADTDQVLVKTYCTGHCLHAGNGYCDRKSYSRALMSLNPFWTSCAGGVSYNLGRKQGLQRAKPYWKESVKKVVIVVRNPMEIVTTRWRIHMRDNEKLVSEANFRAYCPEIDDHYIKYKEMKLIIRNKWIKPHHEGVPCFTEFLRIMMWYENALEISSKKEKMIVYYEDLVDDLDKTANSILNYVGMQKQSSGGFRIVNTTPLLYFTTEENQKIATFMRAIGRNTSPACDLFDRYFQESPASKPPKYSAPATISGITIPELDGLFSGKLNVAKGKKATQSSESHGGKAYRAVDGNTSGIWSKNSVTHTSSQCDQWWEVDLNGVYDVEYIAIYNRLDCCQERLTNFIVELLSTDASGKPVAVEDVEHNGPAKPVTLIHFESSEKGSKVRIQLKGCGYLSLAEVEVYDVAS